MFIRHDIIALVPVVDSHYSVNIGMIASTKKKGCYKISLDLDPIDSNVSILIVMDSLREGQQINEAAFMLMPGHHTHRVYAYIPYKDTNNVEKNIRRRIGSIFATSNEYVYVVKLNLLPKNPNASILAFETSIDERESEQ